MSLEFERRDIKSLTVTFNNGDELIATELGNEVFIRRRSNVESETLPTGKFNSKRKSWLEWELKWIER